MMKLFGAITRLLPAMVWVVCVWAGPVHAQLKIGQTAGITGAVSGSVREATLGAQLYFDHVNAAGGVHGQKIQLISLDDRFDPQMAARNARTLIDQGVIALFLNRGTPHTQAMMPLLTEHKVPLVAPSTGAMALHVPVHTWLFNVRATYQREAERAMEHLAIIGVSRIAIVQVDDSFGDDATVGALNGLKKAGNAPVAHEKYDRAKPDFSAITRKLMAGNPQAVLYIGSGTAIVSGMKALRDAGSRAQMLTLSNNATGSFVKDLGTIARGVVVSQVYPYEHAIAKLIIQEVLERAKVSGMEVTPTVVEGYVSAKVLVEGLRRAGAKPTRQSLRQALESLRRYDAGGIELSYGPDDHTGFDYADLSIIDSTGRFRR